MHKWLLTVMNYCAVHTYREDVVRGGSPNIVEGDLCAAIHYRPAAVACVVKYSACLAHGEGVAAV